MIVRLLDGGLSMPHPSGLAGRLLMWLGRRRVRRHREVDFPNSVRLHPEARIHPRRGRIQMGERCSIAAGAVVQGNVTLGDDCSIQAYSVLVGYGDSPGQQGAIAIGNGVRIAPHVMIIAANHRFEPGKPIHRQGLDLAPVSIEDDVWLAGRVTITAGVRIGKGSVVAAGAVVTRDVPAGSIVAGVPARVIRER